MIFYRALDRLNIPASMVLVTFAILVAVAVGMIISVQRLRDSKTSRTVTATIVTTLLSVVVVLFTIDVVRVYTQKFNNLIKEL